MSGPRGSWLLLIPSLLLKWEICSWCQILITEAIPCSVMNATRNQQLIFNIVESFGSSSGEMSQVTNPEFIPISGELEKDIKLDLVFPLDTSIKWFTLEGKQLKLTQPIDREKNSIVSLKLMCTDLSSSRKKISIFPVIIKVLDINDHRPVFINAPYQINVPESIPPKTIIFDGLKAEDKDFGVNGRIQYTIEKVGTNFTKRNSNFIVEPQQNSSLFIIDLPHQGLLRLAQFLDYETARQHIITVIASDMSQNVEERLESKALIVVNVLDSDDQGPKFNHDIYQTEVLSSSKSNFFGSSDKLNIKPEKIRAFDQDSLKFDIRYSFSRGYPGSFRDFFRIDSKTGIVTQLKPVLTSAKNVQFNITLKAEEASEQMRSVEAFLIIEVISQDIFLPYVKATSPTGFVDEHSKIGTIVTDAQGVPIRLNVTDADLTPFTDKSKKLDDYLFVMTTDSFRVDLKTGFLVVNSSTLDRDPPCKSQLHFQLYVREKKGQKKSSPPISFIVNLGDINDNYPIISPHNDVVIPAGSNKRLIAQMKATDIDAIHSLEFHIVSISNNGDGNFYINSSSGEVYVISPVFSGQSFSLTISVTDKNGHSDQSVLQVRITSGPNLLSPTFEKYYYEFKVSEGAYLFTTLATIKANDPEGGKLTYSIIQGNEQHHFMIEESTGIIRVNHSLDREKIDKYILVVNVEDNGGRASQTKVLIKVTDENDHKPVFLTEEHMFNGSLTFKVKEGRIGAIVGQVEAFDFDIGNNSKIKYVITDVNSPFIISATKGIIHTKIKLDYEEQSVHHVNIAAMDGGLPPLSTNINVTVLIEDVSDEIPFFPIGIYRGSVAENLANVPILQVQAEDPDLEKEINYIIVSASNFDKFRIDSKTGIITTRTKLDYESSKNHTIIVGTKESSYFSNVNKLDATNPVSKSSTCRVFINVTDTNDMSPSFTHTPIMNSIKIRNDAPVGDQIGSITAVDGDGTAPSNVVRYKLTNSISTKAFIYFQVDNKSGNISIRDDLTKELDEEYRLEIRAFDQGTPSLDSTITIVVKVMQVVTIAPESGVGFFQPSSSLCIQENIPGGTILKTLPLVNQPTNNNVNIKCVVQSITDLSTGYRIQDGLFLGEISKERNCLLVLSAEGVIDREITEGYKVIMQIETLSAYSNPSKTQTEILIQIIDENDNGPIFQNNEFSKNNYLISLPSTTSAFKKIFHVQATDKDAGSFGEIRYKISKKTRNNIAIKFTINATSGVVKTRQSLQNIPKNELPMLLYIEARDNPLGIRKESNTIIINLIINVIKHSEALVLTILEASPSKIKLLSPRLIEIINTQSGLIVQVDRFENALRKFSNNSCCKSREPNNTDVYFHVIDPENNKILDFHDEKIEKFITSPKASSNLKYAISSQLSVQAVSIHPTYSTQNKEMAVLPIQGVLGSFWETFPVIFCIILGCLVFGLTMTSIVYFCVIKKRIIASVSKKPCRILVPRYETVFVEPNSKQYETQMLQMMVSWDEAAAYKTMSLNARMYEEFLDNISYITKDRSISISSTQDTATVANTEHTISSASTFHAIHKTN